MSEATSSTGGGVFISYRRVDASYAAGWLYDRLVRRFGRDKVFKDVDSIELGDDFIEVITAAVGSCDVLLALIGDEWLRAVDEEGVRRLDDPDDFVRLEIEAALQRDIRVIPVLVGRTGMPDSAQLPDSLAVLSRRQGLVVDPSRFDADVARLLAVLERALRETQEHRAVVHVVEAGPKLTMWFERDPGRVRSNPADELVREAVSQLSLPGGGNSFLVLQHEGRHDYAQVAHTGRDEYTVEYRGRQSGRHFVARPLSLSTAQGAVCGWAFNLPGWRIRYPWTRLRTGGGAGARPRDAEGRWTPTGPSGEGPAATPSPPGAEPAERRRSPHRRRRAWLVAALVTTAAVGALAGLAGRGALSERDGSSRPDSSSPDEEPESQVVFDDAFTDERYGWVGKDGRYQDGAYRIDLPTGKSTFSYPALAPGIHPQAPQDIRITVKVRSVTPLAKRTGYGILCRFDPAKGSGYPLGVSGENVGIDKIGVPYDQLDPEAIPESLHRTVDVLVAECTTDDTSGDVHLRLWLNGILVAEAVDSNHPWSTGTVGVHASSRDGTHLDAEFDDFVVETITR